MLNKHRLVPLYISILLKKTGLSTERLSIVWMNIVSLMKHNIILAHCDWLSAIVMNHELS